MTEQENTNTVKAMYAAFGRGDIPALLNSLADRIEWEIPGRQDGIPFAGTYRGRDSVGQFFTLMAESIDYNLFEPREFIAQGNQVIALGRYKATAKPSGNTFETEWAMAWTLSEGKATHFRVYDDTSAVLAALTMPRAKSAG